MANDYDDDAGTSFGPVNTAGQAIYQKLRGKKDRNEIPLLVSLLVRLQRDYDTVLRPIEPDIALFLDSGDQLADRRTLHPGLPVRVVAPFDQQAVQLGWRQRADVKACIGSARGVEGFGTGDPLGERRRAGGFVRPRGIGAARDAIGKA